MSHDEVTGLRRLGTVTLRLLASGLPTLGLLGPALPPPAEADTCTSPSFGTPPGSVPVGLGLQPFGIVLGDWNRDGKVDLAVTNTLVTGTVSVRFGDGAGGFTPGADLSSGGSTARGIAAGDFNGDGYLDLVVANSNLFGSTINFLQGSANGTFTLSGASLSLPLGSAPYGLAVGDFDGDGRDDVAVADGGSNLVRIYLRSGPFTFAAPQNIPTGSQPASLVVGDFDRDGDLDIVSVNQGAGNLSFLQNNGSGVFSEPFARTPVGANPLSITAADFDKDGILDLAVAVNGANVIDVLKGSGGGAFTSIGMLAAGTGPVSVAVADFNNDGNPDLVANSSQTFVYLGDGSGGFPATRSFNTGTGLQGVAAGDFNGDGRDDVASLGVNALLFAQVGILLNDSGLGCPAVSFGPAARTFPAGANPVGAARGDFNQDGRLDVVVTNGGSPGSVSVLLANGPGLFASPVSYPVGNDPVQIAVGDLDGDGFLDLVVTEFSSNNIAILKGQAGGAFGPPAFIAVGPGPGGLALADFNLDGWLDIVVSNYLANTVSVLLNTGGGFSGPVSFTVGTNPASVAAGDVNGDGKPDLVVDIRSTDAVKVLFGDGLGGFVPGPSVSLPPGSSPTGLVLADFDGDGDLDAATSNSNANTVSILRNDGAGSFTLLFNIPVGSVPYLLATDDFNGDGDPDLVTSNNGSGDVSVILGGAGLTFGAAQTYPVTTTGSLVVTTATGDFTGDGQVDIVVANAGAAAVTLVVGNGSGGFGVAGEFATFGAARDVATADFDRDGILDVVIPNPDKNTFSVHLGDGTGKFGAAIPYLGGGLTSPQHLVAADFDGDGLADLAVVGGGKLFILKGLGPTFSLIHTYDATGTPVGIATVDFDHDGKLDLAVALDRGAGSNDQVWIFPGLGTGAFGGPVVLDFGAAMSPVGLALADFNHDGFVDLAVAHNLSSRVSILFNTSTPGTISFGGLTTRPVPQPQVIAAGDFKADGHPDLVFAGDSPSAVFYLDNDPVTGFAAAASNWATSSKSRAIVVEDFNLDGNLDVATASTERKEVSILLGKGNGTFQLPVSYAMTGTLGNPLGLTTGDFNRDGRPDLVSANGTRPSFSVLLNTNCRSRRMEVAVQPPACNAKNAPFSPQPRLLSLDDGGNLLHCDGSPVTASLLGGPGLLTGTTTRNFVPPNGVADYTDLAVTDDGLDYRLRFTHGLPAVIPARSQRFTVGLAVDILAPAPLCPGVPHTFSAAPNIFDRYVWTLDTTPPVLGSDRVVVGPQAAGSSHLLQVDAVFAGCAVTKTLPYVINADLSQVTISVVAGSTIVPFAGTGASLKSSEVGGGVITGHQWSYSATSGGPYTDIPGATGALYTIRGADFPAPGIYDLVVTAVSECGPRLKSGELQVIVFTTAAGPGVPFFTVTSKSGQNTLEWLNPTSSYAGTLVTYNVSTAGTSDCPLPPTPGDGMPLPLVVGLAGGKGSYLHTPLANDTAVCYSAFVYQGGGVFSAAVKQVSGRPFDTSGNAKWAYNVGMTSIVPPGNGIGVIHAVAQDQTLHSVLKGASGGTWPAPWVPQLLNGPSQGRPSTVRPPAPISGASRLIFLGSQGGSVYAIDADRGNVAWNAVLPLPAPLAPVQAAPSGYFTFFGGTRDYVLAGTRDGTPGSLNRFYALKLADGSVAWSYDGSANSLKIGVINGQATVDYVNKRVYFASFAYGAGVGEQDTVWCLDLETGTRIWSAALSDAAGSPIVRSGRLYVASYNNVVGGKIHALDAATGSSVWGGATTFDTSAADGPVKLFVSADRLSASGRLLFSTTNKVWALDDPGGLIPPAGPVWVQATVPNPSAPAFFAGGPDVWVGASDGKVYRLDYATGVPLLGIPLGDPASPAAVGSPTLDLAAGFLYVGNEAGIVYAVLLP